MCPHCALIHARETVNNNTADQRLDLLASASLRMCLWKWVSEGVCKMRQDQKSVSNWDEFSWSACHGSVLVQWCSMTSLPRSITRHVILVHGFGWNLPGDRFLVHLVSVWHVSDSEKETHRQMGWYNIRNVGYIPSYKIKNKRYKNKLQALINE